MFKGATDSSGIKSFRLFEYFAIASLVVVSASTIVLSAFLFHQTTTTLLRKNENFALLLSKNLNSQVFRKFVLPTVRRFGKIRLRDEQQYNLLDTVVHTVTYGFKVESVSLYSNDYLMVYSTGYTHAQMLDLSTQQDYLGKALVPDMGLKNALKGISSSRIISLGGLTSLYFGNENAIKKLRTVAPFRTDLQVESKSEPVMGALEIVLDVTDDFREIWQQQLLTIAMAVTIMGLMFVTLLLIVRRAEHILDRRSQEKERLEQELSHAERLAGLGRMIAGVSHEIRNPLGIIKSTAEILAQRIQKYEPGNRLAGVIVTESDRMNAIVTEFLDFARPQVPRPVPCMLSDIIERNLTALDPHMKVNNIRVEKNFSPDLETIMADPDLLYRGLLNIFNNSIQAMPDGGLMKITVERSSQNGLPVQCITVQDMGEGIPPEAMENLFTPFFTTREKGTGLGLAILKNIVEGHGGKIFIDSPISINPQGEGIGTAVSIFLTANRK
jgi:two-component system, NtrC family, sensor histidine kinase HydH